MTWIPCMRMESNIRLHRVIARISGSHCRPQSQALSIQAPRQACSTPWALYRVCFSITDSTADLLIFFFLI
jgi:hypothetical protein